MSAPEPTDQWTPPDDWMWCDPCPYWALSGNKTTGVWHSKRFHDKARRPAVTCPYVHTADEGTSYCALAEDSVARLRAESVPRSSLVQVGWIEEGEPRSRLWPEPPTSQVPFVPIYVLREDHL